ncbi:hypothetical protein DPMN_164628 [Dreissena polymorpha]|uniref:Uncharacterized protein n=1 Tax=Dreissena polymorpha TaxID=45954 RepID=A0A9D4EY59_DREPO|nr:hypothetical protein DPMN_164628 [Dreissena polymorpha]
MEQNVRCMNTGLQQQIVWTLAAVRLDIPFNVTKHVQGVWTLVSVRPNINCSEKEHKL